MPVGIEVQLLAKSHFCLPARYQAGRDAGCCRRNSSKVSLGTWTDLPFWTTEPTAAVVAPIAAPLPALPAMPPTTAPKPAPPTRRLALRLVLLLPFTW